MPDGVGRVMFDAMFDCRLPGVKPNMATFNWNGNTINPSEKQIYAFALLSITVAALTPRQNRFYTQRVQIPKSRLTMAFTEILA